MKNKILNFSRKLFLIKQKYKSRFNICNIGMKRLKTFQFLIVFNLAHNNSYQACACDACAVDRTLKDMLEEN